MNILKKTIQIIFTITTFLILPFIVFTLITSKTDVLAGIRSFVVLTGSMQPNIPQGSIVYAKNPPVGEASAKFYNKGDVITFKNNNVIVTHRIFDVIDAKDAKGVFYKTKGDANNTADSELVAQKDVLGKSVFFVPYVGKFVLFLKTFPGYALLIIFPTVFFIVFELNNIRREIVKEAEKKAREEWKNPKFEARNSKQIQMTEIQMTKTV